MKQGLISEERTPPEVITKIDTTVVKIVEPPVVEKQPAVITQTIIKEPEPQLKPDLNVRPLKQPDHIKDMDCRYCGAYAIANLSLRFAIVVFVIALSINVLKTAKKDV